MHAAQRCKANATKIKYHLFTFRAKEFEIFTIFATTTGTQTFLLLDGAIFVLPNDDGIVSHGIISFITIFILYTGVLQQQQQKY